MGPDELASRAEISRTALYQIESGKTELPRAGTLRRIALALDVSMETLLGHLDVETAVTLGNLTTQSTGGARDWLPSEGAPLSLHGSRPSTARDEMIASRFGSEWSPDLSQPEARVPVRERDLVLKLHELLASPLAEPIARIVEESHRLLPQARTAGL